MNMLSYIGAIQKKFISQYGFKERDDAPGIPANVPDGVYPMDIDGKVDRVEIKGGMIHCGNHDP